MTSSILHAAQRALLLALVVIASILSPSLAATRYYPVRNQEEAAVIEWGNSAIISALDAVVAEFGPQTSQAALLEVETAPVFAEPISGPQINNKDDVMGNVVVMTDVNGVSAVDLALSAQEAEAAALIIVHVDDSRPDEAPRFQAQEGEEEKAQSIDIPVVSISMTSASVLAMALIPEDQRQHIRSLEQAKGLPERIRLYAGEDRPFFEDIESASPTLYLIHNLLTAEECQALIQRADRRLQPITKTDDLSYTDDPSVFVKTSRATLWQGELQTSAQRAVEDRISQVTGFPQHHFSDFIVDKMQAGSYWKPHFDTVLQAYVPVATVSVFLTDDDNSGAEWVYAQTKGGDTIRIRPRAGMAIVHHNTDENFHLDKHVKYSLDKLTTGELYVARKFIFNTPMPLGHRVVMPLMGGNTAWASALHDRIIELFGKADGPGVFDKVLLGGPIAILALIAQCVVWAMSGKKKETGPTTQKTVAKTTKSRQSNGRKKKV